MKAPITISENVRPIMAALKTLSLETKPRAERGEAPAPFITLSRQPGSGAWMLAQEFVETINADHPDGPHWTCWDRELVEKVAADHHLSERLIESLEDVDHSWLAQFLSGISFSGDYDAMRVYRRVAATIRALAQAGHVVIVGRGSGFITRNMAGGIHLRLVAPLEHRICIIERTLNITRQQAADWIAQAERTPATVSTSASGPNTCSVPRSTA